MKNSIKPVFLILSVPKIIFTQEDSILILLNVSENNAFIEQVGNNNNANIEQIGRPYLNKGFIRQYGTANQGSIRQNHPGLSDEINLADIYQSGTTNNAQMEQLGMGNTSLIHQEGFTNSGGQLVVGDKNSTTLIQKGTLNRSSQIRQHYNIVQDGKGITTKIINGK